MLVHEHMRGDVAAVSRILHRCTILRMKTVNNIILQHPTYSLYETNAFG